LIIFVLAIENSLFLMIFVDQIIFTVINLSFWQEKPPKIRISLFSVARKNRRKYEISYFWQPENAAENKKSYFWRLEKDEK
jgi:hypothetical protein